MVATSAAKRLVDAREVEKAYHLLVTPGQVVEVRALEASTEEHPRFTDTLSGYFDNLADLLKSISAIRSAMGIYITLQPCHPDLLHRAKNRLIKQKKGQSTSDKDILCYRWLPIDCDIDRVVKDISSTDIEHGRALAQSRVIRDTLNGLGWPTPIEADSGNGAHLLYRIDLDLANKDFLKRVLEGLAQRFDIPGINVDKTLFNPSRIIKFYGTLACKGDNTSERPHRMSRLIAIPDEVQSVDRALLEAIATPSPPPAVQSQPGYTFKVPGKPSEGIREDFTAEKFLQKHGIAVKSSGPYQGGTRYLLESCAWDSSHTDNSACVYQFPDHLAASCSAILLIICSFPEAYYADPFGFSPGLILQR